MDSVVRNDIFMLVEGNTVDEFEVRANRFIQFFFILLNTKGFLLNLSRTELLIYDRRPPRLHKSRSIVLITAETVIQSTPTIKYLGVILDSTLNCAHPF